MSEKKVLRDIDSNTSDHLPTLQNNINNKNTVNIKWEKQIKIIA